MHRRQRGLDATSTLTIVKLVHTIAWAFFAACVLAIPLLAWRGQLRAAATLIAIVSIEVIVLLANRLRCPLTGLAERFTEDRRDNFDIFLPTWLAKYNKVIFGSLFAAGILLTVARWRGYFAS